MLDALVYDNWARRLAEGAWWPTEPFYWPPGYPYLLGLFYRFISPSIYAVYIGQFLLGLLNLLLIYRLAAAAYGKWAGLVAAALASLYAPFVFQEAKITSTMVGLTFLLLSLVFLADAARLRGWWRWPVAGLLIGLTTLMRPETLLLLPLVLFWIYRWGHPPGMETRRNKLTAMGLVFGVWLLMILPVAIHNVRAGGSRALISSQGGITFFQGNNPSARGLFVQVPGFSGRPLQQPADEKAMAEKALGRSLTMGEASAYWFDRGWRFIRENPGRYLWLLGMKAWRYIASYEYYSDYVLTVERETAWLLWVPFLPFGLFVALAIPAMGRGLVTNIGTTSGRAGGWNATRHLLLLALAANLATCLLFYVSSRYRLPATIPLIVFASATVVELYARIRYRRRRGLWGLLAVVALIFCAAQFQQDREFVRFQEGGAHFNAGNLWRKKENDQRALTEYRRATELIPSYLPAWTNWGATQGKLGLYAAAAQSYAEAARRNPKLTEAHLQQGLMLLAAGDAHGARPPLKQAVQLSPNNFEAQLALGRIARRLGETDVALEHFSRALQLRPQSEEARLARDQLVGADSTLMSVPE